ncbi:PorP/SprF family type IX secretion system membrane protein [Tenacibaculum agarivorans]|uniref:PorP/SprF family type IX secretion system membrane protein n=1 Tax=Tenacibaculum agarivorans TaxID=1908389 RepID=UPI00094BC000|nr:type IX secretion system membrane protein PorP/SprF [Tenacibaculum agarivorans]
MKNYFEMKNNIQYILVFLLITVSAFSQQDPQYTQYMYNTMRVNPAYVGTSGYTIITGIARTQWVGIDGAPDSQTLSFDTPLGRSGVGLGVNLTNDEIGPARELYFDVNASYTVELAEDSNLAFGLKLGGRSLNVDPNRGNPNDPSDQALGVLDRILPTIGAGVFYYRPKWYVGAAVPNLLRTEHYDDNNFGGDRVAIERLHFFLIGGYVFDLNESIKFKPATLVKVVNGAPLSLDVSANFMFNQKFTAGVAWRWDDSISALLGFQVTKNLGMGFAYDLTTSNYQRFNSGTYELMLRWQTIPKKIPKSPRFF